METAGPEQDTKLRSVGLILSTALCIGLCIGLFPALLALNVEAKGYDASVNGALAAMHGLAGLSVAPFVPGLMARLGGLRTYVLACLGAALTVALFVVFQRIGIWFVLRIVLGLCLGTQFVVSDSWMLQVATGPRRATIISLYVVILSVGLALGPLVMATFGTHGATPFLLTAALLVLSSVPLMVMSQSPQAQPGQNRPLGLIASFLRKPSAMLAALVDGFVFQAFLAFLPIYFLRLGNEQSMAISMLNAFFVGGIVMQVAIGYLMDRLSPALVLLIACSAVLAGLLAIAQPSLSTGALWLVCFAIGGPAASIFAAGLAGVNDAFAEDEMASGSAVFSTIWHFGGLCGPAVAGVAMDWWNPFGLLLVVAIALITLGLTNAATLLRASARPQS